MGWFFSVWAALAIGAGAGWIARVLLDRAQAELRMPTMASDISEAAAYIIYLDHPIARRLRRHVLYRPGLEDFEYHAALDIILEKLYHEGVTECLVIGESHSFVLRWSLPPSETEAPHGQTQSPTP